MKLAIMQPYFFPYIGYFQLMQAVDTFVFYDDVQYVARGWMNRNLIRGAHAAAWITLPVRKASRELSIDERRYALDGDGPGKIMRQLASTYAGSPHFDAAMSIAGDALRCGDENVASFNIQLLEGVAAQLGIGCRFLRASSLGNRHLRGQERIIDTCTALGATTYVNAIGGTGLYDSAAFECAGLRLRFLETRVETKKVGTMRTHLSIVDDLMVLGVAATRGALPTHVLLPAPAPGEARS